MWKRVQGSHTGVAEALSLNSFFKRQPQTMTSGEGDAQGIGGRGKSNGVNYSFHLKKKPWFANYDVWQSSLKCSLANLRFCSATSIEIC